MATPALARTATIPRFTPKDVAGTYYFGDGLGVNCDLVLEASSKFSFRWTGCLGEYDRNSGNYDLTDEMLTVHPTSPNRRDGFRGMAERFFPIRWGTRIYLIADEQMLGFVDKIRRGWRGDEILGRSGFYFLRRDAQPFDKPIGEVKMKPEMPSLYHQYLSKQFVAKVIRRTSSSEFELDQGSADGLVAGTMLHSFLVGSGWNWLHVERTTDHSATARPWNRDDKSPTPGTQLTAVDL